MRSLIRLPAFLVIGFIRLYQMTVARLMTPRCRFVPSCSQYTVEAIRAHGLIRGGLAGVWRVVRCGPWTAGGLDPVHAHRGASRG